jgi:AmmeMemoRadiSam system protein A
MSGVPGPAPLVSEAQREVLLSIARAAVEAQVTSAPQPPVPPLADVPLPDASGVFVTVRSEGELRGCLGTLECRRGLAEEVARCAAEAASVDPRFEPVSVEELPTVSLEVSVLGPLEPLPMPQPDAVTVGRHGLVVEQGRHRGLLLPQVAPEWGWTAEQFLRQTCIKAGLPPDAWRTGASVYRFEADVFGE